MKIYKSDNFEIKYPEDWDVWPTSGPGYPSRGYNLILRKEKGIGEIGGVVEVKPQCFILNDLNEDIYRRISEVID